MSDTATEAAQAEREQLGARILQARTSRGLSARALAGLSGISAGTISMVERGLATPRIDTLVTLLRAMNLTTSQLFSDAAALHQPLRLADRPQLDSPDGHKEFVLTRRPLSNFEVYIGRLDPGRSNFPEPRSHGRSQEFVLVQAGTATVTIGDEQHVLYAGDSIEYLSSSLHRVTNSGEEPLEVLWVISPPALHPKENTESVDGSGHV
ncbi:XRE family transcriptional regulator [Arthrobacter sp. UYEF36]|uniref:helix-turn-helix domain-containing protein n=1 Tax=Arthrobacter sp. UYEF36 TaxID=1756366 RepID=UPI003396522C